MGANIGLKPSQVLIHDGFKQGNIHGFNTIFGEGF